MLIFFISYHRITPPFCYKFVSERSNIRLEIKIFSLKSFYIILSLGACRIRQYI
nr:MAG TPA: hypothetical protein [Caudoviricetes sp.]DAN71933.1 MAG TPA: hypothetical protein [Caudoviricetes sp.]